jgi:LL-diaminopimelate aminotransferase
MALGNSSFYSLKKEYIFPVIEEKLTAMRLSHPHAEILNMGIGDIALPLAPTIAEAISKAAQEMTLSSPLYGYGPSEGYPFLKNLIWQHMYQSLPIEENDIFISDGINTDIVNILDLFDPSVSVAIPNPAYPAYLDSNVIAGRKTIYTMPCTEENNFLPKPPNIACDIIYLCSPHNPTGEALTRQALTEFVNYAIEHRSIILFDHAYQAFITSPDIPKSIYEIPGAEKVAIEFCSFSKMAGFTGLRCSFTILPSTITADFSKGPQPLQPLWKKRQSIKFNGVAYPVQKGAAACFSKEGKKQIAEQVTCYLAQAKRLKEAICQEGHICFGGENSPYLWWKAPNGLSSWQFFDHLLERYHILTIPGVGFGIHGEGFIRVSAFSTPSKTTEALKRLQSNGYTFT